MKCAGLLKGKGNEFFEDWPTADSAIDLATNKYNNTDFEDLALYEPTYLKAFVAGKAKDPFGLRK